jgi:hypothetical protein
MSLLLALLHSLRVGEAALFLASVALQTRLAVAPQCGRPIILTLRGGARRQQQQLAAPKALEAPPPAPDDASDGAPAEAEAPRRADGAAAELAGTGTPAPPLAPPPAPGAPPAQPAGPHAAPQPQPARELQPGAPPPLPFVPAVAAVRALAGAGAAAASSPAVAAAARVLGGAVMHPALGAASALLLGVHLLAEGSRWQLLPLYVATGARTRIVCSPAAEP